MPERAPEEPPPTRFLFFGAGAVGSLLGARLAQAGSEVSLVGRAAHVEAVARDGVRMVLAGKVSNQSVRAAQPTIEDIGGAFDYIFLTVKGYDTSATRLACYSGAGFEPALQEAAQSSEVVLIGLDRLYQG